MTRCNGSVTGTSVKHTAPKRILSYSMGIPKGPTHMNQFEKIMGPLHERVGQLLQMNRKLRAAADERGDCGVQIGGTVFRLNCMSGNRLVIDVA